MINVQLEKKPIPVPLIYQPIYKIIMLLAILRYGTPRPHSAPFLTLHFYFWALRSNDNLKTLIEIKNKERHSTVPWTFEPGLERTVTLVLINRYCTKTITTANILKINLSDAGAELLDKVENIAAFKEDIDKIKKIGMIPFTTISKVNDVWSIR